MLHTAKCSGSLFEPRKEAFGEVTFNPQIAPFPTVRSAISGQTEDRIVVDPRSLGLGISQDLQHVVIELNALSIGEEKVLKQQATIAVQDIPRRLTGFQPERPTCHSKTAPC